MRTLRWLPWVLAGLFLAPLGCSKKGSESAAAEDSAEEADEDDEADEDEDPAADLPSLPSGQQALVDQVRPAEGLLPGAMGRALVHAPREWAAEIVRRAYPRAKVEDDNPRVNLLLGTGEADGPLRSIDVRWSPSDSAQIGSVVLSYRSDVDLRALRAALGEVAEPDAAALAEAAADEGGAQGKKRPPKPRKPRKKKGAPEEEEPLEPAPRAWILKDKGLRLSYYEEGYEGGGPRLTFEPLELAGDALSHPDDRPKEFQEWEVRKRRTGRARRGR